jgi:hypothetical protein
MSVAGPVFRIKKERLPEFSRAVIAAAFSLSRNLGYEQDVAKPTPATVEPRNHPAKPGSAARRESGAPSASTTRRSSFTPPNGGGGRSRLA